MTPPTRVLVLGIDAASPVLLERWAGDGRLPHLAALMRRGLTGASESVAGFFIGSTWPSFATGVTPARHGLHYLRQLEPGSYEFYRPADRVFVRHPPFWRPLSDAGRRVAILDVPLTRLDAGLNGVQTVEWGGHDAVFGFGATPPGFAETVLARFGPHPLAGPCDAIDRTAAGYRRFVAALRTGVERKARLTADVLDRGGWDLVVQVFTESHCAGHQCWHLHDAAHPAHEPALAAAVGDPLLQVYTAIDAAIGALVAKAPDATVLLVVAHGMSHWHGAHFLLQDILVRLGYSTALPSAPEPRDRALGAVDLARRVWRALPAAARRALGPLRDRVRGPDPAPGLGVDPSTSRCLPQPNGLAVSGIRFNLSGREPSGMVAPGVEADALAAEVTRELLALIDERTGRPAVRQVLRTRSCYDGPWIDELPDLLVEWSDEVATGSTELAGGRGAVVRLSSDRLGTIEGANRYARTGEHRPGGMFVAAGPGVRAGRLDRVVSVLDYAPTIARLVGEPLADADGIPIAELGPAPG